MKDKKLSILKQMMHLQPKLLRKFLLGCDRDVLLVICERIKNFLLGHVRVKERDLEKYRDIYEIGSVLYKTLCRALYKPLNLESTE